MFTAKHNVVNKKNIWGKKTSPVTNSSLLTAFKWNVFCLSSSPERSGPAATLQPRDSPPYGTVRLNANCSNRLAGWLAGWFAWLAGWLVDCLSVECEAAHLGSSIKPPRAPREGGSIRKERQERGKEELPVEPVWAAHWPESDAGFGFDHKCRKSPPRFLQSHIFNPNSSGHWCCVVASFDVPEYGGAI